MTEQTLPHRVVDRDQRSWMATGKVDEPVRYTADGHRTDMHPKSLDEVIVAHGPVRPVEPITAADRDALRRHLGAAGRKAVATLALSVQIAFENVRDRHLVEHGPDAFDMALQQLMAGRPGSWESELLVDIIVWPDGVDRSRFDPDATYHLARIITRWCTAADRFTEVAETLAEVVSVYADEHGGWSSVADDQLLPPSDDHASDDHDGARLLYGLFYSRSEHFAPA